MRIESAVTCISWIPSDVVTGILKTGFVLGLTRYDDPPPDVVSNVDALQTLHAAERFRFANRLSAWIDVEDGRVAAAGYNGQGYISSTRVKVGRTVQVIFQPAAFPELRADPEITGTEVRFVQTTGGRTGVPMPRPLTRRPFAQWVAPTVWTTLTLIIRADGSTEHELAGASQFPRHWVYGPDGRVNAKSGIADSRDWVQTAFGKHTPWGNEDSKPFVTLAETALERELSESIMRGGEQPEIRRIPSGSYLTRQHEFRQEVYLLLNGVVEVSVDDEVLGELGPGAIIGERSLLEDGRRTATVRALNDCMVAVAANSQLDRAKLAEVAEGHHREDAPN